MTTIDNDANKTSFCRHGDADSPEGTSRVGTPRTPTTADNMKLIPWADIWTSLRVARIRGNGEMIEIFYDTLFKEAIFDDKGAWSLHVRR
jgi:hypothetical protein